MGTVVIVGGGTGGAPAARSLRRKLGPEHRVIIIEKEKMPANLAVLPLYAVGKKGRRQVFRNRSLLKRHGVELIAGQVQKIDPAQKKVYTGQEEIGYDLLLIAAGAELDRSRPLGMAGAGFDLQSFAGVDEMRAALPHFQGTEIAIVVASTNIKCPGAPYEYALLLENWFYRQGRSRDISITVYTPEKAPLIMFGEKTSGAIAELLLKRYIRVHPEAHVRLVDPGKKMIFLENDSFPYDMLLYYAAAAPPPFIRDSGLGGEEGWLKTDRHTMALQGLEDIYAVGDVTHVATPSGEALPKLGGVAHLQSFVAAANMAGLLKGENPGRAYSGFAA